MSGAEWLTCAGWASGVPTGWATRFPGRHRPGHRHRSPGFAPPNRDYRPMATGLPGRGGYRRRGHGGLVVPPVPGRPGEAAGSPVGRWRLRVSLPAVMLIPRRGGVSPSSGSCAVGSRRVRWPGRSRPSPDCPASSAVAIAVTMLVAVMQATAGLWLGRALTPPVTGSDRASPWSLEIRDGCGRELVSDHEVISSELLREAVAPGVATSCRDRPQPAGRGGPFPPTKSCEPSWSAWARPAPGRGQRGPPPADRLPLPPPGGAPGDAVRAELGVHRPAVLGPVAPVLGPRRPA